MHLEELLKEAYSKKYVSSEAIQLGGLTEFMMFMKTKSVLG